MAHYDLKKKPSLTTQEGEKEILYPSIVYKGTIPSETILHYVEQRCGFKDGMMAGILMEVMDVVAEYVGEGYRVELGEFGFFSARIKSTKHVAKKTDIRTGSIQFAGVNFRSSKKFLDKVSRCELDRSPKFSHRQSNTRLTAEELERQMMAHIEKHGFINRVTYSQLTGRLKNTALADLNKFVEKGVIQRKGWGNQMHFVKAQPTTDGVPTENT